MAQKLERCVGISGGAKEFRVHRNNKQSTTPTCAVLQPPPSIWSGKLGPAGPGWSDLGLVWFGLAWLGFGVLAEAAAASGLRVRLCRGRRERRDRRKAGESEITLILSVRATERRWRRGHYSAGCGLAVGLLYEGASLGAWRRGKRISSRLWSGGGRRR